ncbi:MAG TPA: glycosyltransferase family 2 protein [Chloroflexota bacterium]|nr:glycosyltransferase family 2 protein [Chloroflexota bacterium]
MSSSATPAAPPPLPDDESARRTLTRGQTALLILVVALIALGAAFWRLPTIQALIALAIIGYVVSSAYKMYVLYRATRHGTPWYAPVQTRDEDLPRYTILIPLYREAEVITGLLDALRALDYGHEKLEVLFLMEEDDEETIAAFGQHRIPPYVRAVIVPEGYPKTKPRACNYGLAASTGDYLVIYDAEDRPEPDQLRKALAAFAAAPPEVVCQQAKLGYYNQRQNILTRFFTIDYANWFDGILPGLTWLQAPIPLGGTSNHFRVDVLRELGGWDAFNVAEDADLGIRLFRHGYRTAIFDSVTWEEANSRVRSWLRQRSRWVKGYMQTFLVHSRHPRLLRRQLGTANTLSFLVVVGGTPAAMLLNPIFWALGIVYYITRSTRIEALFPAPIYYMGLACLLVGTFVFVYMNVFTAVRWGYDDLAKWALLTPLYWVLLSAATYMALYDLIVRPHHWQKTTHGLAPIASISAAELLAERDSHGRSMPPAPPEPESAT